MMKAHHSPQVSATEADTLKERSEKYYVSDSHAKTSIFLGCLSRLTDYALGRIYTARGADCS